MKDINFGPLVWLAVVGLVAVVVGISSAVVAGVAGLLYLGLRAGGVEVPYWSLAVGAGAGWVALWGVLGLVGVWRANRANRA